MFLRKCAARSVSVVHNNACLCETLKCVSFRCPPVGMSAMVWGLTFGDESGEVASAVMVVSLSSR